MSGSVEQFNVYCKEEGIEGADQDVSIFGTPFHESEAEILKRYENNSESEFFRHEQLHSCGNYILLDARNSTDVTVITSPGYSSGYAYNGSSFTHLSTLLVGVIESWIKDEGTIDSQYLRYFLTHQRPFQGVPFQDVTQVRPGSVYRIMSGSIVHKTSYLSKRQEQPDVEEGFREVAAALDDTSVSVMFSGGLDSLAWYLVLEDELGSDQVDLVTVDWRPGSTAQGPFLAKPAAKRLGVDLSVISFDDGWLTNDPVVVDHIFDALKNDIVNVSNPNHALAQHDEVNDIVFNLTNNESLLTLQMNQYYIRDYINKSKSLGSNFRSLLYIAIHQYLYNLQYTASYMRHPEVRTGYFFSVWPLIRAADFFNSGGVDLDIATASWKDIDLSQRSIFRSIAAKRDLNFRFDSNGLIESEVQKVLSLLTTEDTHYISRLLYYYTHMAWASNTIEKPQLATHGTKTYLPPTWGPALSACIFDDLTIKDAMFPRYQLLDIVKSISGHTFDDIRLVRDGDHTDRMSVSDYKENVYFSIFQDQRAQALLENSKMCSHMDDDIKPWYENQMSALEPVFETGQGNFMDAVEAGRILNLELLLENAS